MLQKIKELLLRQFLEMKWSTTLIVLLTYCVISWGLLALAGETAFSNIHEFFYWIIVTASTVGYGDISPSTQAGKWIVSLFVIPVGLSLFALIIGRAASWTSDQWRKGVRGLKNLNVSNHILVIGWNGQRTIQLLHLLLREQKDIEEHRDVVLCVKADIENPMPGKIDFVKVNSFSEDEDMNRCCVADAAVIIIDNPQDDLTMTTSLYVNSRNPDSHLLAYFDDDNLVRLLQLHCPNAECMPSVSVEMLAKSAFDPGSSVLHHDLLNVDDGGQAQFSVNIPANTESMTVEHVFLGMKKHYGATFIGLAVGGSRQHLELNPSLEQVIQAGDKIFYIAQNRIKNIQWNKFNAG
ncbi:potassium channel family protein [Alteromonas sp. a30]|uniref:potassium channel family protein n=1 Tax=Alteromonas sp. a30 TaxID=2730917 RepID=UPI0022800974|nr:potassium channel family protein [Alteromonas sp. a30]MCY7294482.1 two pore domain potassium channel family protein [Alteromonas sp. a30]